LRAQTAGAGLLAARASGEAAATIPPAAEVLAKFTTKSHKTTQVRVS